MSEITVNICIDCLLWAVNRDDSGASDEWSRDAYARGMTGLAYIATPDEPESHFSWQDCDICGAIPGDRIECLAVVAGW